MIFCDKIMRETGEIGLGCNFFITAQKDCACADYFCIVINNRAMIFPEKKDIFYFKKLAEDFLLRTNYEEGLSELPDPFQRSRRSSRRDVFNKRLKMKKNMVKYELADLENFDESPVQSIYTYLGIKDNDEAHCWLCGGRFHVYQVIYWVLERWGGVVGMCPICGLDSVGIDIKPEDGAEMTDNQKYAVWPYRLLPYGHPLGLVESQEE